MQGWIDGIASETLPMSVENVIARVVGIGPSELVRVAAVHLDQFRVVFHLRVVGRDRFDLECGTGCERARFEAAVHARDELRELAHPCERAPSTVRPRAPG